MTEFIARLKDEAEFCVKQPGPRGMLDGELECTVGKNVGQSYKSPLIIPTRRKPQAAEDDDSRDRGG